MTMKTIMLLLTLSLLGLSAYQDFLVTLFFVLGALWGLINLYLIQQVLRELLLVKQKHFFKILMLTLIKFPVLYGAGVLLLSIENGSAWALLLGFTLSLLLHIRKACLSKETLVHAS